MRSPWLVLLVACACRAPSALGYVDPPVGDDPRVGLGALDDALAATVARGYQRERLPPPIRLAPTDGTELALRRLRATVTIEGPLAHTELHLTFHNPEPRTREGRFGVTLPADAAVARFAMKVAGSWREARVVARQRGREVYETFLHRRVDPALLEQDLGNQFSARVFPIAGGEDKELILAYDEPLAPARPYTLALAGLPRVERLDVTIQTPGATRTIERRDLAPDDVVAEVADGPLALAAGEAFVARLDGVTDAPPAPLARVLYLVDTSASRAPVMARQLEVLRALLETHPADGAVALAVFDHGYTELARGTPHEVRAALPRILAHGALGGSNLGVALAHASAAGMTKTRLVIIGDGVPTIGEREPAKLAGAIGGLFERVDVVQVGAAIDRDTLRAIVRAGRQPGAIVDGGDPARAAYQLARATAPAQPIRVDGATASWPPTTEGIAAGEPIWVFGLRAGAGAAPLAIAVGARTTRLAPGGGDGPRIRRAVARAEVAELTRQLHATPGAARDALGAKLEAVALAHQLVSPRTSLIVLETDADELAMLGPRDGDAPAAPRSGITITDDYTRNIPTGRTFAGALASGAGAQDDAMGVSIAGSTSSLENTYVVEGINFTGESAAIIDRSGGELLRITGGTVGGSSVGAQPHVLADVQSARALDYAARSVAADAFALRPQAREDAGPRHAPPYEGTFRAVMAAIARRDHDAALAQAAAWQLASPGELAAILALGEALEARGAPVLAARAYGSIIDLYPNRAELVRAAAERLDRIASRTARDGAGARALAIDAYRRALRERPDHVTTYRLLAYALLRAGRADEALDTVLAGFAHARRASVQHALAQDAGLIGAYLVARAPCRRGAIEARLPLGLATTPSLRFVLSWETDANDVDLHVRDAHGGHADYKGRVLPSGGRLLDDLTDGWGPELFVVEAPAAFPYRLAAHYYRKGPMGLGLGTVQVIRHDGKGTITVDDRPFAIQADDALVELGSVASR